LSKEFTKTTSKRHDSSVPVSYKQIASLVLKLNLNYFCF